MNASLNGRQWLCLLGLGLAGSVLALRADETAASAKKEAAAAKPGTVKVESGPFRVDVSLKGIFEAAKSAEVYLRPESATTLVVATAVEPGTVVKKGDVLVTLDTEKADRAIRDLEADKELADITLKQAEEELPLVERGTPLELEAAEKAKKQADEDLKHFLDVDKEQSVKSAKFQAKSAADFLEYAKEELKQLQKMYRNKDLTEETEEIILKRTRNEVERSTFSLEQAVLMRDHSLAVEIPRREQSLRDAAVRATLALDKAKSSLPLALNQKRLALAKAKYDRARATEHLDRLKRDRESLIVKAPVDGIVYYGRCVRGQWTTAAEVAKKLVKGGVLMPDEVFITIVEPKPLVVVATVDEKELAGLTVGTPAKVSPTAFPELRLPAKVTSVLSVPLGAGAFEARLELTGDKEAAIAAGMACAVKLVPYRKADALTLPASAVFHDDDDPYVYLSKTDGKPEKRTVATGRQSGDRIEITDGLKAGDSVLSSKP